MNFIKGSRAGLAVAVAGLGIGIAMIIDSVLAEKKFREHKSKMESALSDLEEGVENFTKRNTKKRTVERLPEAAEIIEDHFSEDNVDDLLNIIEEQDLLILKKNQDDVLKMKKGETYAEYYDRLKEIEKTRNPYYGFDLTYNGDGSDASKALYFAKKAFVEAKIEKDLKESPENNIVETPMV